MVEISNGTEDDLQITIITPSYNQGRYIEQTILSIINQDYKNLEYVIIDGGSSDNTISILEKYSDSFSYWVSEKDRGQTEALNKGLGKVQGEIIGWINSDDLLFPETLKQISRIFKENPRVDAIYGDALSIDSSGKNIYRARPGTFSIEWLIRCEYIAQSSFFFRSDILKRIWPLDENLHYTMDYELILKIAYFSHVLYVPHVFSQFRRYPEAKTSEGKYPFSIEVMYLFKNQIQTKQIPDHLKILCISTIIWRAIEISLWRRIHISVNSDFYRLDSKVEYQVEEIVQIINPFLDEILSIKKISEIHKLNKVLVDIYTALNPCFQNDFSPSLDIQSWIKSQTLDIITFAEKLWRGGYYQTSICIIIGECIINPKLLFTNDSIRLIRSEIRQIAQKRRLGKAMKK